MLPHTHQVWLPSALKNSTLHPHLGEKTSWNPNPHALELTCLLGLDDNVPSIHVCRLLNVFILIVLCEFPLLRHMQWHYMEQDTCPWQHYRKHASESIVSRSYFCPSRFSSTGMPTDWQLAPSTISWMALGITLESPMKQLAWSSTGMVTRSVFNHFGQAEKLDKSIDPIGPGFLHFVFVFSLIWLKKNLWILPLQEDRDEIASAPSHSDQNQGKTKIWFDGKYSRTHTHKHTMSHTQTHYVTHTLSHTHYVMRTHTLCHTHRHTLCHTHTVSHTHYVTHTLWYTQTE